MDIRDIVSNIGSSDALKDLAAKAGLDHGQAKDMLQGVLDHLKDGGGVAGIAEGVASKVGLDPSKVQDLLPNILGVLQGHAETASDGAKDVLGGLMGSLKDSPVGGLLSGLDSNKDGSVVDEAMDLAKGLFKR